MKPFYNVSIEKMVFKGNRRINSRSTTTEYKKILSLKTPIENYFETPYKLKVNKTLVKVK